MKKKIIIEMEEETIKEFEKLEVFFSIDKKGKVFKPNIMETLSKIIVNAINEHREERASREAKEKVIRINIGEAK